MRANPLVVLLALAAAGGAAAQSAAPTVVPLDSREPRPGAVREREAEARVAPTFREDRTEQKEVDQLYRELTGTSPAAAAPQMPLGPPLAREAGEENRLYRDLTGSDPAAPPPSPTR
jgi:hypothetical protein